MTQYRKAKKWKGKDLSLHVGNGDKRILDGEVLNGDHWDRFVGLGFLERIPEGQAPAKAPAAAPAPAPVPVPPPAREGGMTRSGAGKAAAATGGKSKGGKGKSEDKHPPTEETDKAAVEKAAELAAGNDDMGGIGDHAGSAAEGEKKSESEPTGE